MKRIAITTLTSILFMGYCLFQASANAATGVAAQEQTLQNQDPPGEPDGRPIEEIVVTGQRSGIQLKIEIERLEAQMFGLFNELNSTDDFDVTCHDITHTGTLIPTWECEPAYLTRARAQNAQDFINCGPLIPECRAVLKDDAELMFFNRVKTEQLNVEIRELALDHPELAAAMLELDAKKQSLVEREQRLREERGFFGLFIKKDEE